ncbi:hypothetical protein ACDI16_04280 [Oceanobacillus caeni]|uniref:hypothetical protein n=1 Tax=Virgibacillus sp. SK37 TaxID=403957 RepID=UPI0011A47717|nr:hypothetical protein [Virgibacillus sp. SK37]
MAKYRKKPVEIDAIQWTGDNVKEVSNFISGTHSILPFAGIVFIETLEGKMEANVGDYIIKGVKGEFYPCKPDIFKQTYEGV